MAFTIRNFDEELLKNIMDITGEKTATKAIERSCILFMNYHNHIGKINIELNKALNEKDQYKKKVENLREAVKHLLE
jgi:hypothetical protein